MMIVRIGGRDLFLDSARHTLADDAAGMTARRGWHDRQYQDKTP